MCGIVGAIGYLDQNILHAVEEMNRVQRHRGPDGCGVWKSNNYHSNHGTILAHRRLAIIDLTDDARQPMIDSKNGNSIVFNGEIYNYRELKIELESLGVIFRSESDTEIILLAYRKWGGSFVSRLRGMFAIVIWDNNLRKAFFYRDRLGIKPLYYTIINKGIKSTLLFSSEIKTLITSGLVDKELNPVGIESFIWNGYVAGGKSTIVKNINMLLPGYQFTVDEQCKISNEKEFWDFPVHDKEQSCSISDVRKELAVTVEQHLISDVSLGVFLSGGVDSSAVASLAVEHGHKNISTYNLAFDEAEYNEAHYARTIAKKLGTDHHEVLLTQKRFINNLDDALNSMDQPSFDGINTYFISREVKDAGITVALSGTGGDELFGGYKSFLDVPNVSRHSKKMRYLPEVALNGISKLTTRALNSIFNGVPPQTRWGKISDIIQAKGDLFSVFQTSYALYTQDYYKKLLLNESQGTYYGVEAKLAETLVELIRGNSELRKISTLELHFFIKERLMRDTDSASMAASLEVRVPLLDHVLIEKISKLDVNKRYYPLGKKQLLKDIAMPKLDDYLFDRPKSGFVLPFDRWCRDALQLEMEGMFKNESLCESVGLNHQAVMGLYAAFMKKSPGIYWSRVWAIYCYLWWCKKYDMHLA